MTREKAIKWQEAFKKTYGNFPPEATEACDMAIEALKEQKWIPVSERLPECENKYGWVSCIVSVIRSYYPTSTYYICDSPYDEDIVMHANYHVSQKIWHLESDEQVNALMDIEDAPLNGDYVIAWQPLPEPYKAGEQE